MFKGVKVFVASLFAMLLCAAPASAISFSSLEQISEPTDNIEINTPEDGYAFDANFLAKNQELKYKTTLTNDESLPIKIENIDLNTSSYNFLEYSYDGISADDTIEAGATRDLIISVRTNSNDTSTVSEDYSLTINYSQVQPEPDPDPIPDPDPTPDPDEPDADKPENPETATTAVVKTGTIALISIGAITFVFVRNKKIRNYVVLFVATSLGVCLLASTATAEGDTSSYTIRGKVHFTNVYTVTVDPNEGTYAGDLQVTRREGESYHIENVSREHFSFVEWEINPSNTPDENNNIEIHANTTLKAKWNEKTYTLTINPNGGKYLDSESVWNQSYRPGQSASISAPTKEGYDFKYWTVEEGSIGQDGRFNGNSVTMNENITLVAYYEIQTYTVTIVPNGGSYTGSLTTTVDWNTDYEIQSISRDGYDLKNWTKTNSDGTTTLSADTQTVNIKSNTTLTANWWSSTFYTVTIDPNGGTYAGDLETQVRAGETYTMQSVTRENYILNYWHYTGTDTHMDDESFVVNSNISLTAEWTFPVARIESTQKLYPSIMAAHEEAESGDTITLLVNDAEIVTNSKNITLDLNQHTVYGYLNNTRNGNITLLNGEINNYDTPAEGTYYQTGSAADYSAPIVDSVNPSGAAVVNAGALTMGIDDYEDAAMNEKVPLINNQYVRLIGSSIGLDQNGHFYFYDGFIEGTIGLKGGYDGSPWYRETFDGTVVNYFPFVTKNTTKNCQHVELSNADKAVSKTIDNGPIYYYNLQDNINTSTLTGYQIYAVRDFDGSYAITVDNGADITFDIIGYTVNLGEDVTVDGKLTVLDSAETKGLLTSSKTIQNNGELVIRDMTLSAMTTNTLLQNNNSLTLQNATITSDKGTTLYLPNQEVTLSLDNNSYIITESNQPALINDSPSTTITAGTITGKTCTVSNNSSKTFTLKNGTITGVSSAVCNYGGTFTMNGGLVSTEYNDLTRAVYVAYQYGSSKIYINGGKISTKQNGNASTYGIQTDTRGNTIEMSGGEIEVTSASTGYPVAGIQSYSNVNITGGHVKVTSNTNNESAGVVSGEYGNLTINGPDVKIEVQNNGGTGTVFGAHKYKNNFYAKKGTVVVSSKNSEAIALRNWSSSLQVETGINASAHSETQNAYGIRDGDRSYPGMLTMTGGSVSAISDASDKLGIGISNKTATITGGTVYGNTYGINGNIDNTTASITLGANEPPLYNGVDEDGEGHVYPATPEIKGGVYGISDGNVYFYDGILKGGSTYVNNENIIKAIPDGTSRVVADLSDPVEQDCWLEYDDAYLKLESNEQTYNSLTAIYADAQETDTITVIRDASTPAVLPSNTKNITFDLNGHIVNYTQPFKNDGTMTITDSSNEKSGALNNNSWATDHFIENNGTLTISAGTITGTACSVLNNAGKTFTLKNGTITGVSSAVCNYGGTFTMNGGLVSTEYNDLTRAVYVAYQYGSSKIYINGGKISTKQNGNASTYGIQTDTRGNTIEMSGGEIEVTSASTGYPVAGIQSYSNVNITGGHVKVTSNTNNESAGVVSGEYGNLTINGPDVKIEVQNNGGTGTVFGAHKYKNNFYAKKGTVVVSSKNSEAIALRNWSSSLQVETGINASAHSETQNAYGIRDGDRSYPGMLTMTGGSVSAISDASDKLGIGISNKTATITGGTVYGNTYGINGNIDNTTASITLGANEPPLYNGVDEDGEGHVYPATPEIKGGVYGISDGNVYFYDGILKGGSTYVNNENIIKAIPDGTSRVVADLSDPVEQDCWLEYDDAYLKLESNEQTYNSLTAIYADAQETDTITVIRDASTPAVLPSNTKNITFDLNGHIVNYTQPFKNDGTMVITDSSNEKSGALNNNSWATDHFIENNGTLTISAGTITGTACSVLNNAGKTFTLKNGTITGVSSAVCNYGGTFTMNGGLVSTEYNDLTRAVYVAYQYGSSKIYINGGKISTKQNGNASTYGIQTDTRGNTIEMSGGEIEVTSASTGYPVAGIQSYSNVNITGGHVKVTSNTNNESAGVVSGEYGNLTINGPDVKIEVQNNGGTGTVFGAHKYKNNFYAKKGTVVVSSKNSEAIALRNWSSSLQVETGINASAHSETQNAYGIRDGDRSYPGMLTMTGGSVSAISDASDKLGIGISNKTATITGGTVYGNTYGINGNIDNTTASITLGANEPPLYNGVDEDGEGHVYPATPEIKGGVYGISDGNVYFYDGILKGGSLAYFDRNIKAIADNTYVHGATETIDGKEYQVRYLANKEVLAKIGNTEYYSLQAAADAANDGDEIDLVADNYIFEQLNFPANKTISVDFNGFEVVTGNQVINNGNVTLFDSSNGAKLLRYAEANWFITNEANASLTIDDIDIQSRFAIYNKADGTVTLKNLAIGKNSYSETAIENYGNLNLDNVEIHATNRAIYTTDGNLDIQDSDLYVHPYDNATNNYAIENNNSTGTMTGSTIFIMTDLSPRYSDYEYSKFAYVQTGNNANFNVSQTTFNSYTRIVNGEFTFTNGTMTRPEGQAHFKLPLLYNSGTTIVDSSSIILVQDNNGYTNRYPYPWTIVIDNAGTLTVKNGTTIKHDVVGYANYSANCILNNTGTLTLEDTRINQERRDIPNTDWSNIGDTYGIYNTGTTNYINSTLDLSHYNVYGIYAESGNVNIYSGTVKTTATNNAFALWAKSGAITLGEAEPTDSPNYGTANANVSTTSPNISAIGDNLGIGVTLENGSFNFYDGKITQNSTVGPAVQADHVTRATVTNVEYLYQPETYTDTSGHTYFILEFMR